MARLFISYRREESQAIAWRMYEALEKHFGDAFLDADKIPAGMDFRVRLMNEVNRCDAFLAVIGERWAQVVKNAEEPPRLHDPGDYVRIEIEAALSRDVPVIPVLTGRATMPRAEELPESLRPFAFRHACQLDEGRNFHHDMSRLIASVEQLLRSRGELAQPITLTVIDGLNKGRDFRFTEHNTFLVGRAEDARFRLPETDLYLSRRHFMIEVNPPLCKLMHLSKTNKTYVNGKAVEGEPVELKNRDRIQAGRSTFEVGLPAPAATLVSEPAAEPVEAATIAPLRTVSQQGDSTPPLRVLEIPGYEIQSELGRGGMGVVYQARRLTDGALLAVKVVRPATLPTPKVVARFLREAEILKQLQHPNIVAFRDMGVTDDQLYFAMDYVDGIDAAQLLRNEGPLDIDRAVAIICQVLEALEYAHAKGFVHRDIKPANILISASPLGGEGQGDGAYREVARLADFGLARSYQDSALSGLTMTQSMGGTPGFMPPEQITDFRSVKPAADQYAAAATLYHLLTHQPLYDGVKSMNDLILIALEQPPVPITARRPDVPPQLAAVIHKALALKPNERFASVDAFRRKLQEFLG